MQKPTLLIVDDSRLMRHSLKKILKDDFDLVEAVDGEDGWEKLLTEARIQGVFSDLSMPNLDGYGLLERIRSTDDSRIRSLPFIVITGKEGDDQSLLDEVRAHGANDVVSKPFKSDAIIAKTKMFLQQESARNAEASVSADAEARRHAEQEAARLAAEQAEAQRRVEEEAARLAAEQAEAQRRVEEEADSDDTSQFAGYQSADLASESGEREGAPRSSDNHVEPQPFTPLTWLCVRLALPFLDLSNRLLDLGKDDQLAALRKRLND